MCGHSTADLLPRLCAKVHRSAIPDDSFYCPQSHCEMLDDDLPFKASKQALEPRQPRKLAQ